ncbi:MAG: purine-nucleoside phosphorylase [Nitrososphaeria archaeon]|nr:purine-nucleoside phosphorylase [Conexivisphaerales archaeon]
MPLHIKANKEDIAERVLLAGDPDRVRMLSGMLENVKLVNENRGYITYSGKYGEEKVTIACHGIGGPSIAIVVEELFSLGAKAMIRFGTVGGLEDDMNYGDLIIATGAFGPVGSTIWQYSREIPLPTSPSFDVVEILSQEAKKKGLKHYLGPVYSDDAFYAEGDEYVNKLKGLGYIGVEMEAYTLFGLANLRGFKSGALFMVSNNLVKKSQLLSAAELKDYLERAAHLALDSLVRINI